MKDKKKLTIGIDWDGTFTEDPSMFLQWIRIAQKAGHKVVIVTARESDHDGEIESFLKGTIPVLFTGTQWKRKFAEENGYIIDIWIEDSPEWVSPQ